MKPSATVTAYIALGSNIGHREQTLRRAVDEIASPEVTVTRISSFLENPAVGGPIDSPPFLNAAAELQTTLPAHALLRRLLEVERKLGRTRREKWEPRSIDLDLLLYADHILSSDELVVPHPLMHERRFVLEPLAQIAPRVIHPMLQMTIEELLANLHRSQRPQP